MSIRTPIEIQLWPITKLIPYERNSRTHSDEQIDQIVSSIKEFGFTNPILVDSKDGIIAGHGRLMAAKKVGLDHVPVIVLDYLTDAQRRAYIIADNKLALNAGWDLDLLSSEIAELHTEEFGLKVIGFSDAELEQMLGSDDVAGAELPNLASGDKKPIQQITFTLSDEQADVVREAVRVAIEMGDFVDTENENKNGNGIARVAEMFLGLHGQG